MGHSKDEADPHGAVRFGLVLRCRPFNRDIYVGVNSTYSDVLVNGKFYKNSKLVSDDDFIFRGLSHPGNTSNPQNSKVTMAFVDQFLGINTLGIARASLDFGLNRINQPHIHHRGTEMLVVVEETLYMGLVESKQLNNRFFTKMLNKGDVFVFPKGMMHFQLNVGQNPGLITIENVFGAKPPISADVMVKALQVCKNLVNYLTSNHFELLLSSAALSIVAVVIVIVAVCVSYFQFLFRRRVRGNQRRPLLLRGDH